MDGGEEKTGGGAACGNLNPRFRAALPRQNRTESLPTDYFSGLLGWWRLGMAGKSPVTATEE